MLQLRFLQPLAPGSALSGQNNDHRNSKQTVGQLHYSVSNHTLAKTVTRAPRAKLGHLYCTDWPSSGDSAPAVRGHYMHMCS